MTPRVSVNLGSNRPGGIDIALAGLIDQTFQNFEVIFVDGLYHLRHKEVLEAVRRSGLKQPFYHVPNHRYREDIWGSTCAGYNTGFMLSAGEFVVMLLDYAYAPPRWLESHVEHQTQRPKIVMAPHEYRTIKHVVMEGNDLLYQFDRALVDSMPPEKAIQLILAQRDRFPRISIFPTPFTPNQLDSFPIEESDTKCQMATGPSDYTYFNTKNESFPLKAVLDVGGMDEHYDLGRGPGDPDLALRLSRTSDHLQPYIVNEAIVHCLNPRRLLPNLNIVIPEDRRLPPPWQDRWYIQDGYRYLDAVKKNPQRIHAHNPYDIRKKRKEIWHWRELSQKEEAVIPRNIIADRDYYPDLLPAVPAVTGPTITGPHMFDPRTQLNYIVWHNDQRMEEFIRHLIETIKPDRWVETGTHMGWTSMWIAANYPDLPLYTVEVDDEFYRKASENLARWPQVSVTHSSSPEFLTRLYPLLQKGLSIFWLDAHWWPPVPLRQECKIISTLDRYVCLLDDFSCWDPDWSGDTFYGRAPNHGSCHLNDLYYVGPELGYRCWRPSYDPQPGNKGYGLFLKGVEYTRYTPPAHLMKMDSIETEFTPPRKENHQ